MHRDFKLSKLVNNFVAFQLGWLACALLHNSYAVIVVASLLVWLYFAEPWSKVRMALTVQIAVIGIMMDIALTWLGIYTFDSPYLILPFWLVLLWFLFASTLSVSLRWVLNNSLYSFVGGCIIGPAAYWGGVQFNALAVSSNFDFIWVALAWGVAMVLFGLLHRKQPNDRVIIRQAEEG
ncbi:MAG: DUF2878 domain-containing protein [Gammaproteobacteria bacterium]|nr:DUF2878 domain-containing protein [Gammaproteobacteria bacterium]